ncbi:hypothetical protein JB92DRAFT_3145466 [Gautieria morchelliformis]|nr:hypothetical protein JB92DRAFT_3145466 [Gautieria morchelliformis]
MFVYTPTSSPAYSSPTLYPLSHYVVAPPVPTARERYLRAVAEERAARARYMSELEEQRILASLRQQEALRQAEFRQHQAFAAQNDIARRRVGRIYAENLCRPVASPHGRRQAFVRQHGGHCFATQRPQSPLNNLEALISALLQDTVGEDNAQRQQERARADQASKADILRFARSVERAFETTQGNRDTQASQPLGSPTTAPEPDSSRVPRQTEMPRKGPALDHAARTIQQQWRARSVNAVARNDAVATIATLRARFQFINDTFSFPEHLEFGEHATGQEQEAPPLLFTPANAAVHAYIHELTKLLTLADAVSSHGSDRVRGARRSFVRLVEEALDNVDRRVAKVWGKRVEDSIITPSSKDALALETSATLPVNVVQHTSDPLSHPPEPDVSLPVIDSTAANPEFLASECGSDGSTNAATIIPHATTNLKPRTSDNSPTSALRSQDVPSEHGVSLPTPEEAIPIPATTNLAPRISENTQAYELRQDVPSEYGVSLPTPEEAIHIPATTNLEPRISQNTQTYELRPQDVPSEHGASLPTPEEAIHIPATTSLEPRISENTLTYELRPQDVPSERGASLPTPKEAIHILGNTSPADTVREHHSVPVPGQYRSVDPEEASPQDLNSVDNSSPNSPLSQSRETSQVPVVADEVTGDDVIPTRTEGVTITSAPGLTTAEPFDVVYPDSPSSSSIAVEGVVDFQGPGQNLSVPAEEGAPGLRATGDESQNNLTRDVEEEGFELL